ncbi:MAG: helix-turn-helix domain-containing protein [Geobacteraceae bacterium]|nr:helix-turn-helix domain-containing protein [Geobacteraceae bacterium]
MPARPPITDTATAHQLLALGQQIRAHRKALRISAIAAAEAAGISRVTLFRIEKGEPAVTMGAYMNTMTALGLNFGLVAPVELIESHDAASQEGWIPARIRLMDYPQLKQLAWQVQGTETLSPIEAWNIYDRNWRHMDQQALTMHEQKLIDALRLAFGGGEVRV